jgi:RimJ/RimL family protein N-acetyltransferase
MNTKSLFEGELVKLTALDPEKDCHSLALLAANPAFFRFTFDGIFRPLPAEEIKKKYKELLKESDEKRRDIYFAVHHKAEGTMLGLLHFGWMMPTHQFGNLFLQFCNEEGFRDFGADTLTLALEYAFMELSLHRLEVILPSYDKERLGLFESAGFLREVQRRDGVYHNGKYHDELIYAILKPEWLKDHMEVKND